MQIERIVVGALATNCYLVTCKEKTIIIDPGDEDDKIIAACKNKNVVGVLVTHHHFDHITALKQIEKHFGIKESTKVSGFDFEVIKTPGHTRDSLSYYFPTEKVLFSGDFLFYHSIGRTDLATGDDKEMQESLEKIKAYPDEVVVYPGHGETTSLGEEKLRFSYYY